MLRVALFGRPTVRHDEKLLATAARPKVLPLLAYLLLHDGAERRHAAADLWPDYTDSEARTNLRRHLAYLKQWLPAGAQWFETSGSHVHWNERAPYWCDAREFERLDREGEREAAVALYQGDLCSSLDEEWLEEPRREFAQRYTGALAELARSYRARRSLDGAVRWSRKLLEYDPWREDAIRQLMLAKYEAGDRAGSIAEYEDFRHRLNEELHASPMSETVAIYEAIRRDIPPAGSLGNAAPAKGPISDFPFVGRTRELAQLSQLWAKVSRGEAAFAYVLGEAGIGKTRLLREFASQCEASGGLVFWTAVSTPEQLPYEPFVQLIKNALPFLETVELPEVWRSALDDMCAGRPATPELTGGKLERRRARIFEAVAMALIALSKRRPVCVVVDDLHAARSGTLELARYVQRRLSESKTVLALSYRDDESHLAPELRLLRREAPASTLEIPLRRLNVEEVDALLQSRSAVSTLSAPHVIEATAGNPLFVTELLRGGDELVRSDSTFEAIVQRRVNELAGRARSLAEIAAVSRANFSIELLREITNWPEADVADALSELIDRHIVMQSAELQKGTYLFAHALIAQALYDEIPQDIKRNQHRRTAQTLERLYDGHDLARIYDLARHWDAAESGERAAPYYIEAARRSMAIFALEEARAALKRSLELAADIPHRFEALLLLEEIASIQGDRDAQERCLHDAQRLLDFLGVDEHCRWLRRRSDLANAIADRQAAARYIGELRTLAEQHSLPKWIASALEADAKRLRSLNRFDEEEATFKQLTTLLDVNSERFSSAYLAHADTLIYQGRLAEARGYLDRVRESLNKDEQRRELASLLMTFSRAALVQQDYASMADYAWQAHAVSVAIGDREGEALALHNIANGLLYTFDVEQTRRLYAEARELYRILNHAVGRAGIAVDEGLFYTELGVFEAAEAL
ncbi:MAG: AAA family ATPase, partial [Candidatus Eremiobacteraeota bacterium]|nr:AAA family ATPase [Candidatus Eremiobacteraeota bacterium]